MIDPKKIAFAESFWVLCQKALKFGLSAKHIKVDRLKLVPNIAGEFASSSMLPVEAYPLVNGLLA